MKALLVFVLLVAASEARAQGGVPVSFGSEVPDILGAVLDGPLVGLGLTSGVFATAGLLRGEPKTGWLILSGLAGAFEVGVAVGTLASAHRGHQSGGWRAFGAGHLALGLLNLAVPILAVAQSLLEPQVGALGFTPMALHGVGPGGRRWSGVGVEVNL